MKPLRIFISSVQKEFTTERTALRDYLIGDPLMRRFFEPFLFERVPAKDRRADQVYLHELEQSDIYLGLFGDDYGNPDKEGYSPTEREFNLATQLKKQRFIFIKGTTDESKHPRMQSLVLRANKELVRQRFATSAELIPRVYATLVDFLEERELIRSGPFDATPSAQCTISELDEEKIQRFIREARRARNFPLREGSSPQELLTHLNLLDEGRPVNAAVLLFGRQPQRFLISSEIKCAHFHGTEAAKPIPSYQIYKGTVFELVDQAVDFVLSKLSLAVGTRAESTQAPVAYEIPPEVVREAIVNAVAHRDYTSHGSVQVMLFSDRVEVWNPGTLPPSLTLERLRQPHGSVPHNPLLAESLYLAKYIERMGTGTGDMIRHCRRAGLPEPEFAVRDGFVSTIRRPKQATAQVGALEDTAVEARSKYHMPLLHETGQVTGEASVPVTKASKDLWAKAFKGLTRMFLEKTGQATGQAAGQVEKALLTFLESPRTTKEIQDSLGLSHRETFLNNYLSPMLDSGLLERTFPEKPTSPKQRYQLTAKGRALLKVS